MRNSTQDRPIDTSEADQLDRGPFVDSLFSALVRDRIDETGTFTGRISTGYIIGLTGRWGLGKSSVLNLLNEKLRRTDHVAVAMFNPWLFKGRDELISGFFASLRAALGRSTSEEIRALRESLDRYFGALNFAAYGAAAVIDANGGMGGATTLWKKWGAVLRNCLKPRLLSPDEERVNLEKKIAESGLAVVVLIDELDRVEDEEVRAVAQLVKAIGDIKGISYLVAYDSDRVIQALGKGTGAELQKSGELYLEKIVQHSIPLRPLFKEDIEPLLGASFSSHGLDLVVPHTERQRDLLSQLVSAIETPREIKRLSGAFSVLEAMTRGEISSVDMLAYCWILTKSPSARDAIVAHIDDLVIDPGPEWMSRRIVDSMNRAPHRGPVDVLGPSAAPHAQLLELLFPKLGTASSYDSLEEIDGLNRRRNLIRVLYLGDPPNSVKKVEVREIWGQDEGAITATLRSMLNSGRLRALLDRVDDILPELPARGDKGFWIALSRVLDRADFSVKSSDLLHALADDAVTLLNRFGLKGDEEKQRLRQILNHLIDEDDLTLAPGVLRKHLFAYGLTVHSSSRSNAPLSEKATKDLLAREIPRYAQAVLDGTALSKPPNTEAIYVLANTSNWSTKLKSEFTKRLAVGDGLKQFLPIWLPSGYGAQRKSIEDLADISLLSTALDRLLQSSEEEEPLRLVAGRLRQVIDESDDVFGPEELADAGGLKDEE